MTVRDRTAPQPLTPSRALGVAVAAMFEPMPSFAEKPAVHQKTDAAVRACAVFINRHKQLALQWQKHLEPVGDVKAPSSFTTDDRGTFVIQRGHTFAHLDFPWRVGEPKTHCAAAHALQRTRRHNNLILLIRVMVRRCEMTDQSTPNYATSLQLPIATGL